MRAVNEGGLCLNKVLKSSSGGCLGQGCQLERERVRQRLQSWLRQKCPCGLEAVACVVLLRTAVELLGVHWPCSPSFSPQSSQPSTTSPFKQEVFVYSPSPSSESPSLGAAATPIIMSRSPTGQWHAKMCMT